MATGDRAPAIVPHAVQWASGAGNERAARGTPSRQRRATRAAELCRAGILPAARHEATGNRPPQSPQNRFPAGPTPPQCGHNVSARSIRAVILRHANCAPPRIGAGTGGCPDNLSVRTHSHDEVASELYSRTSRNGCRSADLPPAPGRRSGGAVAHRAERGAPALIGVLIASGAFPIWVIVPAAYLAHGDRHVCRVSLGPGRGTGGVAVGRGAAACRIRLPAGARTITDRQPTRHRGMPGDPRAAPVCHAGLRRGRRGRSHLPAGARPPWPSGRSS